MSTEITEAQINKFVGAWFQSLDQHVPLEEVCQFLADADLEMIFPEKTLHGLGDFAAWYSRGHYSDSQTAPGVTNIFFDEVHSIVSIESMIVGDHTDMDVVAAWTMPWIDPPKPTARRVSLDSTHKWKMRASNKNAHDLDNLSYKVVLQYAPGSARL